MRIEVTLVAALILSIPAANAGEQDLVVKPSSLSVRETIDRLSKALTAKGIKVMARVDHSAGAEAVGLKLAPTELLIFGNPKLGTPLMQKKRTIGLDLPMKVLAWQDNAGKTWLAYTRPDVLKKRYGISGRDKIFDTMTKALNKFTTGATK